MATIVDSEKRKYELERRGLQCKECGSYRSRVIDTYRDKEGSIHRKRQCTYCQHVFSTREN